jgi:hypothetical protein
MAKLSAVEKSKLEKLFMMESGYVLSFSNATFKNFVADSVELDIYDERYTLHGTSKANRLRNFWEVESDHVVAKLLADMLDYCSDMADRSGRQDLHARCQKIAERLRGASHTQEVESLPEYVGAKGLEALAASVREAARKGEPEIGLDRLHTYMVRYMRGLCERHGIEYSRRKPLNSLMGEYIKRISEEGLIETEMTKRILKMSISTLESFCAVRNNRSLAHDNDLLTAAESRFIVNHVVNIVHLLEVVDGEDTNAGEMNGLPADDITFEDSWS